MPSPHLTLWPTKAPAPGAKTFALLGGMDAAVRAIVSSALPLQVYQVYQDADHVSLVYLMVGLVSLVFGLTVPTITRLLPRRWTYTLGCALYLSGHISGMIGGHMMPFAIAGTMLGTVTCLICLNAYILDYIAKTDLGRNETLRMLYSGLAWTIGPFLGVSLYQIWAPLPYMIAAVLLLAMLVTFWVLRLGNGKVITKARGPTPNPLNYINSFLHQPRLIVGWTFAVIRGSGWQIFTVYLPIYAVNHGLDPRIGGLSLSVSSCMLFLTPLMLRWMQQRSVRIAVRTGFLGACITFTAGTILALMDMPWGAVWVLTFGTLFLLLLDVSGSLPFLLAVKPSERTEMAAILSSFRDVAGIFTPALAWTVLAVAPLPWIFAAMGGVFLGCWGLAGNLHPRLGVSKRR